jgi:sphingolipid 4-desaturase/C4-monooxygenase
MNTNLGPSSLEMPSLDPHMGRARKILHAHPEIRRLFGPDPRAALFAGAAMLLHVLLGIVLAWTDAPLALCIALAWVVGAFLAHALFASMHEAFHGLVFREARSHKSFLLLLNLPLMAPFAMGLRHYHLLHHLTLGQEGRDPDLPSGLELRLFDRGFLGKALWHLSFPILQVMRTLHHERRDLPRLDGWLALNVLLQLAWCALVLANLGMPAVVYFVLSTLFVFTLHPLFGRFIQEHVRPPEALPSEESFSYVGPLNRLCLNFGLHVEHHDLPGVSGLRLWEARCIAREFYDGRTTHASWSRTWLRFLTDPRMKIGARWIRAPGPARS